MPYGVWAVLVEYLCVRAVLSVSVFLKLEVEPVPNVLVSFSSLQ